MALRAFILTLPVVALTSLMLFTAMDVFSLTANIELTALLLAATIASLAARCLQQEKNDHSTLFTHCLFFGVTPLLAVLSLLYIYLFIETLLPAWSVFCVMLAGAYGVVGKRITPISSQSFAIVHGIIIAVWFAWLSGTWLTTVVSVQIAIMALQTQYSIFRPHSWAIKSAMAILVIRLTLLPYISSWQSQSADNWGWALISYLPTLVILAYARTRLIHSHRDLASWFEGAFLHLTLMTLFTQTNYWLTGQYGYLGYLDFTSAVIFANQALVMGLVCSYRSQFAQSLRKVYHLYSYVLWVFFTVLIGVLNSVESPLLIPNVSASALPLFNMLTLGWLVPAAVLVIAAVRQWDTLKIPRLVVMSTGLTLGAVWIALSIRQFWQTESMTLASPTSMAELFSYSVAGLLVGALLTWVGVTRKITNAQRSGLAVLAAVALKVFLWDVSSLDGFWRAISFLGLGSSLIALGWLFQKLNRSTLSKEKA